jgi:hypothetical protein
VVRLEIQRLAVAVDGGLPVSGSVTHQTQEVICPGRRAVLFEMGFAKFACLPQLSSIREAAGIFQIQRLRNYHGRNGRARRARSYGAPLRCEGSLVAAEFLLSDAGCFGRPPPFRKANDMV